MIKDLIADEVMRARVVDAVCCQYNRPLKVKDADGKEIDNPVSCEEYCDNIVKSFLREVTVANEANKAAEAARHDSITKAKKEIVI